MTKKEAKGRGRYRDSGFARMTIESKGLSEDEADSEESACFCCGRLSFQAKRPRRTEGHSAAIPSYASSVRICATGYRAMYVAGVMIFIPRHGGIPRGSSSPVRIKSALPDSASSRNLSSFGSRHSVTRSCISTISSVSANSTKSLIRTNLGAYRSNFGRSRTSESSASVSTEPSIRLERSAKARHKLGSEPGKRNALTRKFVSGTTRSKPSFKPAIPARIAPWSCRRARVSFPFPAPLHRAWLQNALPYADDRARNPRARPKSQAHGLRRESRQVLDEPAPAAQAENSGLHPR